MKAERLERPMSGRLGKMGAKHSGVRVTLKDGSQHLVHKGKNYNENGWSRFIDGLMHII